MCSDLRELAIAAAPNLSACTSGPHHQRVPHIRYRRVIGINATCWLPLILPFCRRRNTRWARTNRAVCCLLIFLAVTRSSSFRASSACVAVLRLRDLGQEAIDEYFAVIALHANYASPAMLCCPLGAIAGGNASWYTHVRIRLVAYLRHHHETGDTRHVGSVRHGQQIDIRRSRSSNAGAATGIDGRSNVHRSLALSI